MVSVLNAVTVLARTVICERGILRMMVIRKDENRVEVTPFDRETAATVFEPSPVAIIKKEAINDFLIDDLEMLMRRSDYLKTIHDYLMASGLYADLQNGKEPYELLVLA